MTLFGRNVIFARFRGGPVNVGLSSEARRLFERGVGVTAARDQLRAAGLRFSNQAFTDLVGEFRGIQGKQVGLSRLPDDFRPGRRLITFSPRTFKTQRLYTGFIRLRSEALGLDREIPFSFGDDRLLTAGEIRERAEAIAEQSIDSSSIGWGEAGFETGDVVLTAAIERI